MIGIGGIAYDILIEVDQFPCVDGKVIASGSTRTPGGFISNTVCAAAELGLSAGYVGWIGDDDGGKLLTDDFVQRGVDVTALETVPDAETPYTVILVTPDGDRSIVVPPSPLHNHEMSAAQVNRLNKARVIYTYPRSVSWCQQIAHKVHSHGGLFALDIEAYISLPPDELETIVALTDVLFIAPSIRERMGMAQPDDLQARGWIIETHGAAGATGYDSQTNTRSHVPALSVPVVDTTGAGDCFHAAVIAARLWGYGLQQALTFATAAAAISIQYTGARSGLPTKEQVEALIDGT
ncbi:MAG: carbohydrate kinase family protein [Chloroflexota bacterium]